MVIRAEGTIEKRITDSKEREKELEMDKGNSRKTRIVRRRSMLKISQTWLRYLKINLRVWIWSKVFKKNLRSSKITTLK
jgi:hypothetical protein